MAIGRTNAFSGGGGGGGAVLTVTAPAGVTVSVSKDGKTKTKTANADGLAVFKGLATGAWTLTITDGVQTSTKTVSVTADYSTVIAFFSATINITYPAGSTCTCSDGSTTLTAPDTSGTWVCIVPNTGTWTVSCTDGTESKSETVEITADGQSANAVLEYIDWDKNIVLNGRTKKNTGASSGVVREDKDGAISFRTSEGGNHFAYFNDVDLTNCKKLTIEGTFSPGDYSYFSVWSNSVEMTIYNGVARTSISANGATLDISSLSGKHRVGVTWEWTHTQSITNMYME